MRHVWTVYVFPGLVGEGVRQKAQPHARAATLSQE